MPFGNRISETLYSSGQPSPEDLRQLAADGFKRIIDLRPASEARGFEEAKEAVARGLEYLNLPVASETDLTIANVRQFDAWLGEPHRPMTLIHCASGNRVGALFALRAGWLKGMSPDAALAEGRVAGLKSLESAVRAALGTRPAPQP